MARARRDVRLVRIEGRLERCAAARGEAAKAAGLIAKGGMLARMSERVNPVRVIHLHIRYRPNWPSVGI